MKLSLLFTLFFILPCVNLQSEDLVQSFDRSAFYEVMASGKTEKINEELILLN
jgi:hypothetical protein